jgi:hypothetical protein
MKPQNISEPPVDNHDTDDTKPGFWHIVLSTLAAAFGVQSNKNHQRDFKHGHIGPYIAAGIIFTLLFIAVVATIVASVLKAKGL